MFIFTLMTSLRMWATLAPSGLAGDRQHVGCALDKYTQHNCVAPTSRRCPAPWGSSRSWWRRYHQDRQKPGRHRCRNL